MIKGSFDFILLYSRHHDCHAYHLSTCELPTFDIHFLHALNCSHRLLDRGLSSNLLSMKYSLEKNVEFGTLHNHPCYLVSAKSVLNFLEVKIAFAKVNGRQSSFYECKHKWKTKLEPCEPLCYSLSVEYGLDNACTFNEPMILHYPFVCHENCVLSNCCALINEFWIYLFSKCNNSTKSRDTCSIALTFAIGNPNLNISIDFAFVSYLYNPYLYYKCKHKWKNRKIHLLCLNLVLFLLFVIKGEGNLPLKDSALNHFAHNFKVISLCLFVFNTPYLDPFHFAVHSDSIQNPFEEGGNDVNLLGGVSHHDSMSRRRSIRTLQNFDGKGRTKHQSGPLAKSSEHCLNQLQIIGFPGKESRLAERICF